MGRNPMMSRLARIARLAEHCRNTGEDAQEAIGRETLRDPRRRRLIQGAAAATAGLMMPAGWTLGSPRAAAQGGVAIVGAGLAGLSCAYQLAGKGVVAQVFEAGARVGGRCWSLRGFFPGQVAERGGELIDTTHTTMRGYANAFGLTLENVGAVPGETYYRFDGRDYPEAQVVEEYRAFVARMREDLHLLRYPTADAFTEAERVLDQTSLDDYLRTRGAGRLLHRVIDAAYTIEYGAAIAEQSSIAFLRFIHADRRSKFTPFGVFSDERFHVVEGNDRIATGLAERLPAPVEFGHRLVAVRKLAGGRLRLTFDTDGGSVQSDHDVVVLTLPFSVLRGIDLDVSLGLPAWKRYAIDQSAMGDNSKLMVGFRRPYWYTLHSANGAGYADLPNLQCTWETNPINSDDTRAVMTDYTGGALARALDPGRVQTDAGAFLDALEQALPGANQEVRRDARGDLLAFTENWTRNPLSLGAYSCNRPGYFTTIADNEAKPVDNLLFAGEHTSSFYEWQGFMEGAALSGLRAAREVVGLSRKA